jgi:hypothetical protein
MVNNRRSRYTDKAPWWTIASYVWPQPVVDLALCPFFCDFTPWTVVKVWTLMCFKNTWFWKTSFEFMLRFPMYMIKAAWALRCETLWFMNTSVLHFSHVYIHRWMWSGSMLWPTCTTMAMTKKSLGIVVQYVFSLHFFCEILTSGFVCG